MDRRRAIFCCGLFLLVLACVASLVPLAAGWEREPLSVFGERRAKLIVAVNAPPIKH